MNAAFLIMSSAALAGADPAPPPLPPAAPVVVSGAGCNNCGTPAYSSGDCCGSSKGGLFDRLKGRLGGGGGLFGKHKGRDCGCAPACAPAPCPAPAPCAAPPPCNTCNACATSVAARPNLLDALKSRMGHRKHGKGDCGCAPACGPVCDPCGAGQFVPPPPVGPGPVPPKEMPKPKDEKPKGGNTSGIPQPYPGSGVPAGTSSSPY